MQKGEIARYEQFLLFPQCFQKAYFPWLSKSVIVWKRVKRQIASFWLHLLLSANSFKLNKSQILLIGKGSIQAVFFTIQSFSCLAWLFSEKTRGIAVALALSLSCVVVVQNLLIFCDISVIDKDIYLKLGVCVQYPKSNLCFYGRQFQMHFSRIMPLSRFKIFILYQGPHSGALSRACDDLV